MKLRFLLPPLLALAAGCARSPEQDLVESLCDNMLRTMDMPAVSNLVENLGADVNGRSDYRHCTPLYAAIQNGNEPAVRYLLEHGADPNRMGNTWKTGPGVLGFAASAGNLGIVQALVEAGADVRGVDPKSGEYPLARAAWNFRPEVLEYLYSKGAVREPGSKSLLVPDGHPKLDAETDERYARTLRVLVAHGENIDEPSLWGPPLAYAAANNATNAMAVAVELGADVNSRAGKSTPLHEAVRGGHEEAVEFLMAHGTDPFASRAAAKIKDKGRDGSALDLAVALGNTNLVRIIGEGLRARTSPIHVPAGGTRAEACTR